MRGTPKARGTTTRPAWRAYVTVKKDLGMRQWAIRREPRARPVEALPRTLRDYTRRAWNGEDIVQTPTPRRAVARETGWGMLIRRLHVRVAPGVLLSMGHAYRRSSAGLVCGARAAAVRTEARRYARCCICCEEVFPTADCASWASPRTLGARSVNLLPQSASEPLQCGPLPGEESALRRYSCATAPDPRGRLLWYEDCISPAGKEYQP